MKIAVLGTGMVGETIGTKLIQLGHDVCMGSRTADNEKALAWVRGAGPRAGTATFANATVGAEIIFFCTKGEATLAVAHSVGEARCAGKIVVDLSNPLDFSHGLPPSLSICNTNSLGEELQRALPSARVIKTLNIVNCQVMTAPARVGGTPTMLLCGNDPTAKQQITALLKEFGWRDVLDLGGIENARGTEMLLPVWMALWRTLGHFNFGFGIVRPEVNQPNKS